MATICFSLLYKFAVCLLMLSAFILVIELNFLCVRIF